MAYRPPGPPSFPPYGIPPAGFLPPAAPPLPGVLPPMPNPWDPSYPAWYQQWQQQQQGHVLPPAAGYAAACAPGPPPGWPPGPPPAQQAYGIPRLPLHQDQPAAKKLCVDLSQPPPPPPSTQAQVVQAVTLPEAPPPPPEWQAARRGAVIYETPRAPTPSPPPPPVMPVIPPLAEPPPTEVELRAPAPAAKPKLQWWYDGQSWVYSDKQPEMKEPEPKKPEFEYTYAGKENPVASAVMANLRGKFKFHNHDKPKAVPVRCETCSLTVSCEKTYETHINGKAHKKRVIQMEKLKKEEEKKKALTLAKIEAAKAKVEAQLEGKPVTEVNVEVPQPEIDLDNPLELVASGELRCMICNVRMNSRECANSHVTGSKHKKALDKFRQERIRGGRGFGPMRGGFGRAQPAVSVVPKAQLTAALAQPVKTEENKEGEVKHEVKQEAMQEVEEEDDEETPSWPPPGITIIATPDGSSPGAYRCELCQVNFTCERNLQCHLVSPQHKESLARGPVVQGVNKGGIWRAAPNTSNRNAVRAQRGRRGLISYGEVMPEKLTKSQKSQSKDIAAMIQQSIEKQGGTMKVMPLLMSFVRGETIQADRFFVSGGNPAPGSGKP